MTLDQAYDTLFRNGHFPLLVITKEDFMDQLGTKTTKDETASIVLKRLFDEWENGSEYEIAMQMAEEYLKEIEGE
jgi:hypothetical protein